MQATSELHKSLLANEHWVETSLVVGESGRLITKSGDNILFGGTSILVATSAPESGYRENVLKSVRRTGGMFANNVPAVGCCVSSELEVEMYAPVGTFPRMGLMIPYVRVCGYVPSGDDNAVVGVAIAGESTVGVPADATEYAEGEWIKKGVFYIDTREVDQTSEEDTIMHFHAYDAMLKAEAMYPETNINYPATDTQVVQEIASYLGVPVDDRTWSVMTHGYVVQYPVGYTCREVLGYIAAAYAGCFVMSDTGNLWLVQLAGIPPESNYLIDSGGYIITFGGDRIIV